MARKPARPEPVIGHNSDAQDEADRVQMISIISKLSTAEGEIESAMVPVRAARAGRKRIIGLGKAAGFTAKELEARLEEMKEDSREQEDRLAREAKHRRWLGITRPDQPTLGLGGEAPEEVRDEAYWKAEGYKAGLRRLVAKPPEGIPQRFVQAWLAERARGAAEVPADHGDPPAAGESTVEAGGAAPPIIVGGAEDGFEATPDELALQRSRKSIEERRQADAEAAGDTV